MVPEIKILTLNVCGLNSPIKRHHLGKFLSTEHVSLVCWQETRLWQHDAKLLRSLFKGKYISYSLSDLVQGGIVGNIHGIDGWGKKYCWIQMVVYDILIGLLDHRRVSILGIYAPNGYQTEFWRSFCSLLHEKVCAEVILLGDLNVVVNTGLDRLRVSSAPGISSLLFEFMKYLGLLVYLFI